MRISIIIFISVCFLCCSKYEINKNTVLVLGHGGMGFDNLNGQFAPNSVASISKALDFYDLDGVEVDIQASSQAYSLAFSKGTSANDNWFLPFFPIKLVIETGL